ncbi:uncharacterized protein LOC122401556 [Colletes gigas]|uniref:uncharacterized protein LOC122401556 n=1 Tax=Colletes gigas TaxID=935657 RepID=UPI001C9AC378|nr:uncharacterized protein LOC122401556 [Colletes gigas]
MRRKVFSFTDATFVCCIVAIVLATSTESNRGHVNRTGLWSSNDFENNEPRYDHCFVEEGLCLDFTEYIDDFFRLASEFFLRNELDPMTIPDIHRSFRLPFLFLPTSYDELTYYFSSGSLYYLSEFKRAGGAIGVYKDETLSIDASIAFDSILFTYDYFVRLLFLENYGRIIAEATSIRLDIGVDFNIIDCKFVLRKLRLTSVESMTMTLHGNSMAERLIIPITNVGIRLVKKLLTEEIEKIATEMFQEHIELMNENISPWKILTLLATT